MHYLELTITAVGTMWSTWSDWISEKQYWAADIKRQSMCLSQWLILARKLSVDLELHV